MQGPWELDMFRRPIIKAPLREDAARKTQNLWTNPTILVRKIYLLRNVITMRIGNKATIGPMEEKEEPNAGHRFVDRYGDTNPTYVGVACIHRHK